MQAAMDRLGGFVSRRRKLVLAVWILLLIVAAPLAKQQTGSLTGGGFEHPGSGSQRVSAALPRFPSAQAETLAIVFANSRRDPQALTAAVDRVEQRGFKDVHGVRASPAALARARAAGDQPIVVMPLDVTAKRDDVIDAAAKLRTNLDVEDTKAAVGVHLVGQGGLWAGMQELSKQDLAQAERVGLPVVLIVLLIVFGSLAAAALPLALGVAAVTVTGAIVYLLAQVMEMSIFVTNMASMLGIGVAVDYSLFILARYREEVRDGRSPADARRAAMRTSGLAVVFSGVTVVVALAGLFLIDAKVVHSMAIGAIVVVAVAVLAAVTLLPALIALLGRRVSEPGRLIGRLRPRRAARTGPGFWERWTGLLMRHPLPFAIGATALMLLIALPGLSLQLGTGAIPQFPKDFETRVGFDLAARANGPGATAPIQVVADFGASAVDQAAVERYARTLAGLPDVARVAPAVVSRDGHAALLVITPRTAAEDDASYALVDRVRASAGPAGAQITVGGPSAQNTDFNDLVFGSLWKVALFVIVLSGFVLLLVLRSVVLPIKAVLMNVLSIAAAYGVLVTVFQYGWFDGLTGFHHLGYVQALTPALLLAIVFGLSMDYEVFMLSRIKERYAATHDNRAAVAQGLAASAGTISSAAAIMVAVFAIFAGTGVPQIKEIGVGLAVAIFLDATVVRLVLVPATMELLGDRNWWLPGWLDRILPAVDFEGRSVPAGEPAVVAR